MKLTLKGNFLKVIEGVEGVTEVMCGERRETNYKLFNAKFVDYFVSLMFLRLYNKTVRFTVR